MHKREKYEHGIRKSRNTQEWNSEIQMKENKTQKHTQESD